jgi:hypothetical protein
VGGSVARPQRNKASAQSRSFMLRNSNEDAPGPVKSNIQ